jgi:metallo-beta-lactamase class B
MRTQLTAWLTSSIAVATVTAAITQTAQVPAPSPDTHVAAARAAAGQDLGGLFDRVCAASAIRPAPPRPAAASGSRRIPTREAWHVEPVKVFDNLYFVGESEFSAWAVITSDGIIVIDTLFDYSVKEQVVAGLTRLGQDPARIKYVIVSHGHSDHSGGARFLQDEFGAKVILSAADWDLLARNTREPQPRRDIVATDGMRLTLGDTTLTLYLTPGHTAGTISTLIPVRDGNASHLMAEWGGTAFNFPRSREAFQTYIDSAVRFREIAQKAGADGVISNHTEFDGSKVKLPALALRKPGAPHPYVVGPETVTRYLTVAEECAKAAQAALPGR